MCGIAGCITEREISHSEIEKLLKLMRNRGPDSGNYKKFNFGNKLIYLFHTRLKILDLNPRSDQPFLKNDICLIYNGEIYNYIELRKDLETKGHSFFTTSDTEVLMNAYIEYGENLENYLEGMWAFAIFDKNKNNLFLSRDRFGEKPLYYSKIENNFYFGSEIKYLQSLTNNQFEINVDTIKKFLVYGYKSIYKTQSSYYKNINHLQSSSKLFFKEDGEIVIKKYWKPKSEKLNISIQDAIEGSKFFLESSLKKRMRSDVPIAFNLSGGVDSSSLIAIAKKKLNIDINSYSIIDEDPRYNEEKNITKNIKEFSTNHKNINLKNSFNLEILTDLIKYHDQPLCTISYAAHAMLQEQISNDGYKVSISGTAADEIYSGYYDHHLYYLHSLKKNENYSKSLENWEKYIKDNVRNPYLKDPYLFENEGDTFRDYIYLNSIIYKSFLKDKNFQLNLKDDNYNSFSILRNRMLNELFKETVPIILENEDLNAMKYSVENRSPFLDTELINFMNCIPFEYLIQDGYSKYILRETTRDCLNDDVRLDRTKKGFNLSVDNFLNLDEKNNIDFLLSESPIYEIVDKNLFNEYVHKEDFKKNSDKKFIFNFINTKIFMETC